MGDLGLLAVGWIVLFLWGAGQPGADYLKATYHLDWWHYEKKLRAALPGDGEKFQQELMNLLWEGKKRSIAIY